MASNFLLLLLGLGLLAAYTPAPARAQAPPAPACASASPVPLSDLPETARHPAPFDTFQTDCWLAPDKAKHVGVSFLLTLSGQYALTSKAGLSEKEALPLAASVSAFLGLSKELYDWKFSTSRFFSLCDLVADLFGIVLAIGFVWL